NYRMSNLLAGVGRAQLAVLDRRVEQRRAVFELYRRELGGLPGVSFMPEAPFGRSTRWLTVMLLDPSRISVTPDQVIDYLLERKVESRPVWKPLHLQPLFVEREFFAHGPGDEVSTGLFRSGVCLPSGSNLAPAQQGQVIGHLKRLLAR